MVGNLCFSSFGFLCIFESNVNIQVLSVFFFLWLIGLVFFFYIFVGLLLAAKTIIYKKTG